MWREISLDMIQNYQDYLPELNRLYDMQAEMNSWYKDKMTIEYIRGMIENKQIRGIKAWVYFSPTLDMTLVTYRGKEEKANSFRILTASLGKYDDINKAVTLWHEKLKEIAGTYDLKEAYAIMLKDNYDKGNLWFGLLTDDTTAKSNGIKGVESTFTVKNKISNFYFN